MAAEHHKQPLKPSDRAIFNLKVYEASATVMDFETYCMYYEEVLHLLWWNYDVDTQIVISKEGRP